MANTKISALTALANPTWSEEFVYAYNNANWKVTLNTMKSFIWEWGTVTTLSADANIWELAAGTYITDHDLYYKTGESVPRDEVSGATYKQMIFVVEETNGVKWFFAFSVWYKTNGAAYASYGWSGSSSAGRLLQLGTYDWALKRFDPETVTGTITAFTAGDITQIVEDISDDVINDLKVNTVSNPYPWMTYTVYVSSVAAGKTYSVTTGTWVTNPLNITLPSSSDKKCVITCLITSPTTAIVTGCTIEV